MKAEIIASGTELLLGDIADTNTAYLAGQLAALGIDLYYSSTVGDNFERYSGVLHQAWQRSDLVITTGGLGPTQGDITREVVAALLNEKASVDPSLKRELTAFFKNRGIEMPDNNLKQATLIPSATALRNASGTAPGWWVEKDGRTIITLPGPPGEMQSMWQKAVLPRLKARSEAIILSRTLKTWGLSEGRVDVMMAPFLKSGNPTLALYAKANGINLRITAKAPSEAAAAAIVNRREQEIRGVLDKYIWGTDNETLEGIIGGLLVAKKLTLAVAETFTGGMLAHGLVNVPDSHLFFKGGTVLAAPVRTGEKSTTALVAKTREHFRSDIGLAISGRHRATASNSSNAFIGIAAEAKNLVTTTGFPGNPQLIVRRTITQALIHLRDFIKANY
jgi:nicotinamide-nucleotide amidase